MTTLDAEAMRGSFTAEGAATGTVESRVGINRFAILGAMIEGDKIVFTPSEVQKAKKRVLIAMTVAIPDALVELPENPNGFAALTLAKTTIGYAIKTSAGWLDLADQSGVASFPVAKPIERLVFAGCGDLGGVSGDYLVLPGFTFSIQ